MIPFYTQRLESPVVLHIKQATPCPQQFIREYNGNSAMDVICNTCLPPPLPPLPLFSFFSPPVLHLHQALAEDLEQKLSASRNRGLDSVETCQEGSGTPMPEPAKRKPTGSMFLL